MNQICSKLGIDYNKVRDFAILDKRLGTSHWNIPGPDMHRGFGGSCFPKDTLALAEIGKKYGSPVTLIEQTVEANEKQKKLMAQKIEDELGDLKDKQLAILGLAFKPNTDDMREAPAINILNELAKKGAKFKVYDPQAYEEAKWRLENIQDRISYCDNEYETMEGSDALVIITEWNQFRKLDLDRVKKSLKQLLKRNRMCLCNCSVVFCVASKIFK